MEEDLLEAENGKHSSTLHWIHGQRSLVGYSMDERKSDADCWSNAHIKAGVSKEGFTNMIDTPKAINCKCHENDWEWDEVDGGLLGCSLWRKITEKKYLSWPKRNQPLIVRRRLSGRGKAGIKDSKRVGTSLACWRKQIRESWWWNIIFKEKERTVAGWRWKDSLAAWTLWNWKSVSISACVWFDGE